MEEIECPVPNADLDCPYCTPVGYCTLRNPWEECDDYYAEVGDDKEEE